MISKLFKSKLLSALIFIAGSILAQQGPILEWVKPIGGNGFEEGKSIAIDSIGSVYTTGYFNSSNFDFDPGPGTYTLPCLGMNDVFISKLDSSGNFIWAKAFGGNNDDQGLSIVLDTAGNIYVVGIFATTADLDPGPGTCSLTSFGSWDVFVLKLNTAGNFVWGKQIGGTQTDRGYGIKTDLKSNVFITGDFYTLCDFDPGPGSYTLSTILSSDPFVCKLDSGGNFVMAKQISTNISGVGNGLVLDPAGNIYVTGGYRGLADFDPSPATYNLTSTSTSNNDIFIWKLDPLGNFLWAASAGGSAHEDRGTSIGVDVNGNVYTTGFFRGIADFDPGPATYTINGGACAEAFVLKLNSAGKFGWAKAMGGASFDEGHGMIVDRIGNSYVTGFIGTSATFGSSLWYNGTANECIFITKLDSIGNFIWAKGMESGYGHSIAVDERGQIYTTGWFSGTTDFDPDLGQFNVTSGFSTWDVFIHKMSLCNLPAPPVNTTPTITSVVCYGTSATLSAVSSGSVAWFFGPTFLGFSNTFVTSSGFSPGVHVYYVDAFTCGRSGIYTPISYTVLPGPSMSANTTATNLCVGQTATITASGASTYTWNTSSTNTVIVVSPTTTTNYTVTGTGPNSCTTSITVTQSISACTNMNEFETSSEINLFPNPTSGVITIKARAGSEIHIFNILGESILNTEFKTDIIELDLSNYAKGIYFAKIGSVTRKILKE